MSVINAEDKFKTVELGGMLSRLLKIIAVHDENVLKNPFPYLKAAYDDVMKHRYIFEEIQQAAAPDLAMVADTEITCPYPEIINIPKKDYDKYKKVMALVSQFGEKL